MLNGKTYKFTNQEKDQTISEENKYMDIVTANLNGATIVADNYLQEESYKSLFKRNIFLRMMMTCIQTA
mgnify:CR=1 FL=1